MKVCVAVRSYFDQNVRNYFGKKRLRCSGLHMENKN